MGVPPPPELEQVPEDRVVGLTIAIEQLLEIRKARLQQLGMGTDANYGLRDHVRAELEYAHDLFRKHPGWMVVDVSGRAIEETATIILEVVKDREDMKRQSIRPVI
jgi:regulator of PEP synthase PpsR (kinase-PPPase family)